MLRYLAVVIFALSLMGCSQRQQDPTNPNPLPPNPPINPNTPTNLPGDYTRSLQSGGLTRSYQVHVPANAGAMAPLVLVLHGGSGTGEGMKGISGFNAVANLEGFVVVYPDGYQKNWADGRGTTDSERAGVDDVAFFSALIDRLLKEKSLDPRRMYVTGLSNGGFMSGRLGCQLSSRIAAFAAVGSTLAKNLETTCNLSRPVPMLLIHGTADAFVPAAGGTMTRGDGGEILSTAATIALWRRLNGCSGSPSLNVLDPVSDGTRTQLEQSTCLEGSAVGFYRVENGGHTWPGGSQYLPVSFIGPTSRDFSASQAIWNFFKAHPKP